MPQESESIRAMAGLGLKNNIRIQENIVPAAFQYVKECCIQTLGDLQPLVRGAIGSLVTTIITKIGLQNWPEIIPRLMELLSQNDYNVLEVDIMAGIFDFEGCHFVPSHHPRAHLELWKKYARIPFKNWSILLCNQH